MKRKLLIFSTLFLCAIVLFKYSERDRRGKTTDVPSLPTYGKLLAETGLKWKGDDFFYDGKRRLLLLRGTGTEGEYDQVCKQLSITGVKYSSGYDPAIGRIGYPEFEPKGDNVYVAAGSISDTRRYVAVYYEPLKSSNSVGVIYLHSL